MPGRTGGTLPELSPTMEAVSVELASGQGRGLRVLVHPSGQCVVGANPTLSGLSCWVE